MAVEMTNLEVRQMNFDGVWELKPRAFADSRGEFVEAFVQHKLLTATGEEFPVAQVNLSTSVRGTIRGIHYAELPPGQAKYVQCVAGRVFDVVVDLREGSPTYGQWDAVELDSELHNAIHIPAGFGHAFQALTDGAKVMYLCSTPFNPEREHGIHPLDETVNIAWPIAEQVISEKDLAAPRL